MKTKGDTKRSQRPELTGEEAMRKIEDAAVALISGPGADSVSVSHVTNRLVEILEDVFLVQVPFRQFRELREKIINRLS